MKANGSIYHFIALTVRGVHPQKSVLYKVMFSNIADEVGLDTFNLDIVL